MKQHLLVKQDKKRWFVSTVLIAFVPVAPPCPVLHYINHLAVCKAKGLSYVHATDAFMLIPSQFFQWKSCHFLNSTDFLLKRHLNMVSWSLSPLYSESAKSLLKEAQCVDRAVLYVCLPVSSLGKSPMLSILLAPKS